MVPMTPSGTNRPWPRAVAVLVLALLPIGCIWTDPSGSTPPIETLPLEVRPPLLVAEMKNDCANAVVAEFTRGSVDLLADLLRTSRRWVISVAPRDASTPEQDGLVLETSVTGYRDEDAGASVVYLQAQSANRRRRAVVEIAYALRGADGSVVDQGTVRGQFEQIDVRQIVVPTAEQMRTGAYWNSPFGRATRDCLDGIVRRISERKP